jgi:hypothetical protein
MPIAGPLIGAAATIGGGLIASHSSSKAAKRAAAAQTASDAAAIAEQRRQYDATRADLAPYRDTGGAALVSFADLLGLNGADKQAAAITAQKDSPLYRSLFENGENTILANASATGGLRGGNTQRSLADFGRDTLASVIENQLNRLGGAASMGQNAAVQTGSFGQQSTDAITRLLADQGQANAGAALASGAANVGAIKDITGALAGLANNSQVQAAIGKLF